MTMCKLSDNRRVAISIQGIPIQSRDCCMHGPLFVVCVVVVVGSAVVEFQARTPIVYYLKQCSMLIFKNSGVSDTTVLQEQQYSHTHVAQSIDTRRFPTSS